MGRSIYGAYFFYFSALFMSWVCIGQIIQYNISKNILTKVDGVVSSTAEITKRKAYRRPQSRELRIFLQNTPGYYRLMDVYNYSKGIIRITLVVIPLMIFIGKFVGRRK